MAPHEALHRLAARQLALNTKPSWFAYVAEICCQYDIDANESLKLKAGKDEWKVFIKATTTAKAHTNLLLNAAKKSTLRQLISPPDPRIHSIWCSLQGRPHLVEQAEARVRLLIGRGPLNGTLWRQRSGSNTECPLCGYGVEDLSHLLLQCQQLEEVRAPRLQKLKRIWDCQATSPGNEREWSEAILNGDSFKNASGLVINLHDNQAKHDAQLLSLALCHKLLVVRDVKVNDSLVN